MKHLLTLVLACLLLCGCGYTVPEDTAAIPAEEFAAPAAAAEATAPQQSALQIYPLEQRKVQGMLVWNDQLLLLSGYGATTLTLLSGTDLSETGSYLLNFELSPDDPSLRLCSDGLSCFDPAARQTVVLDSTLQEVRRITCPGDLVGQPILSEDGKTLFYCTASDVRAWDLGSGIRRCVKEMAFDSQQLANVLMDGTVLQCRVTDGNRDRSLFFSAENGQQLWEGPSGLTVRSQGSRFYASVPSGFLRTLAFGDGNGEAKLLSPRDVSSEGFFLPSQQALVAASAPGEAQVQLEYYDLDTGRCQSMLALTGYHYPRAVAAMGGEDVYILTYDPAGDRNVIYRWDVSESSAFSLSDDTCYVTPYYTADNPDTAGLAACQAWADRIGQAHGIRVLIGKEAAAAEPWDYDLTPEHLAPVLQQELQQLEKRLQQYPPGFLEATASHFTSLNICLVRQIAGTAESGSLALATGLQFLEGTDAYVAIAAGGYSEQALYHELFHVIETRILSESQAFDQWDELNPAGFRYDYDYAANANRDSGVYLFQEHRAFVDTYSMSFPKEDRARIMEYAMLPKNEELFQATVMQAKLKTLCDGIRDAYDLEGAEGSYIWEQYLE